MNPDGTASNALTFTINAPALSVSGVSPNSATAGGAAFILTVNGTGFVSGSTVQWNGSALTTTFVSAAQLTASVPASLIAAAGSASVTVTNPDAAASSAVVFTISPPAPTISTLSPSSATVTGATFQLTVNGTGFISGAAVHWNSSALLTTFVNSTQLTASVPASLTAAVGSAVVAVIDPDGASSNAVIFTINPQVPVVTGLSPVLIAAAGRPSP